MINRGKTMAVETRDDTCSNETSRSYSRTAEPRAVGGLPALLRKRGSRGATQAIRGNGGQDDVSRPIIDRTSEDHDISRNNADDWCACELAGFASIAAQARMLLGRILRLMVLMT